MFDCKTYNEKLTKKIPFIKSSHKNFKTHKQGTTAISTIQYQFNDGTKIVLESVDDTDYENYVTVTFRDNVWDCANKLVTEYEMEFPESIIPYFWNIGFKDYKLARPNQIKTSKFKMNNNFVLIPNIDSLINYIRDEVNYLKDRGLVNIVDKENGNV